jgi:hypothetical protein
MMEGICSARFESLSPVCLGAVRLAPILPEIRMLAFGSRGAAVPAVGRPPSR